MLTTRSKEIRMKDYESFNEFYANLNDIMNSSFNLIERIPEAKIVRNVMRYLAKRFISKDTDIEKSKDLDAIKIKELVGSIQIYEFSLPKSKKKYLAFNIVQ